MSRALVRVSRIFAVAAMLVIVAAVTVKLALYHYRSEPPLPTPGVDSSKPGPGHAAHVGSVWFVWLSGPPEIRGADMWRLVGPEMVKIDATMHETFKQVVPSFFLRQTISLVGQFFSRHLTEDIPVDIQREIVGQMQSYADPFDDGGGKFPRFLAYLALHDLAQTIEKSPLIACTGFAMTGASSKSGGTLVGRNFDFEAGRVFDEQKAVIVQQAKGMLATVSVAWPGMNGIVTGINQARVYISVNAARSDDESARGTPVSLIVREVLEKARTAEDAVEFLEQAHVRVADLYLIADPRHAYVLEKTPARFAVRTAAPTIAVTNHFLDSQLRAEKRNQKLESHTTSLDRYARVDQLVNQRKTPADARDGLSILRDRTSSQGAPWALGDRHAIDGYIATHGVLVDFGRDILWISQAPHLSGEWLGVELAPLLAGEVREAERLPSDPDALALGKNIGYRAPNQ